MLEVQDIIFIHILYILGTSDQLNFWLYHYKTETPPEKKTHPVGKRMQLSQAWQWKKHLIPGRKQKFFSGLGSITSIHVPVELFLELIFETDGMKSKYKLKTIFTKDSVPFDISQQHFYYFTETGESIFFQFTAVLNAASASPELQWFNCSRKYNGTSWKQWCLGSRSITRWSETE